MDTITQIALGSAVGETIAGKEVGNKAPFWGAAFGVVPDLDIMLNPFLNEVQQIAVHRGFSHSLLFCLLAPPFFGWLLSRLKWNREVEWGVWSRLVFWVILTHIFIDLCTSYGTQIFQPFSNSAVSFNSIFIIDPLYTIPLLAGIFTALFFERKSARRRWVNYIGLGISSFYLLAGFGIKWHVTKVFQENLRMKDITADRYMTTPAPLTVLLWTGYAEERDTVYTGLYSIFDNDREMKLIAIPRQSHLIAPYRNDLPVRRLIWFSNGYYSTEEREEEILFSDLRFGRSDIWLTDSDAEYVWTYRLKLNPDSTEVTGFHHFEPSFSSRKIYFSSLINRILGE